MKLSSSFKRRAFAQLVPVTFAFWLVRSALLFAAPLPGPTINVPVSVSINDEQATNLFAAATVAQAGSTNVTRVLVDFSPTNFGFLTLPVNGALVNGTNVLTVTNATDAQVSLRAILFTPVANLIPVPNSSNVVFHVLALDTATNSASGSTTLHIAATNNPSVLTTGAPFTNSITDKTNTLVFTNVTIADVDDSGTQSVSVTITLDDTNKGTFTSLSGFTSTGSNYLFTGTAANATTAIQQLVFVPTPNRVAPSNTETTTFTISLTDGYATTNSSAYSVTALSINDAPTITAGAPLTSSINDQMTALVFSNATIADVDLTGTQTNTVTLTFTNPANGTFNIPTNVVPGFTNTGSNYIFYGTITGTPAQATAALRALVFVPTPHQVPVGSNVVTTFTLLTDDHSGGTATNSQYSISVVATNDLPVISGTTSTNLPVQTGSSQPPLPGLTISDVDQNLDLNNHNGENLTWTVTLSGTTGPIGYLELNGANLGTNYSSSGDPVVVSGNIRSIIYHAPSIGLTGTNVLTLTITADDGHGVVVSTNQYLDLYSVLLPPGLTGMQSGQSVYDNATITLFSKVNIQSFNGNYVTVGIALTNLPAGVTNDTQGTLINLGSFTKTTGVNAPSVYKFSGTSEAATAAIRTLLFQPTPNRIKGSSTETAVFGITLVDGPFTNVTDTTTTVRVVPVNDAPTITGISALFSKNDDQTFTPFPLVLINDTDESSLQTNTVTISLDNPAKGTFSTNSLAVSGFVNNGGSYTRTATPATLTAAIRQLVFVPTPGYVSVGLNQITTFTITANDGYGGITINSGTQARITSVTGGPFVNLPAEPVSIRITTNIFAFAGVTVADTTPLKLSLTINNPAQGTFTTNSLGASTNAVFTDVGGGTYFIQGWATNITAALAVLDFAPATNLALGTPINFTINVTNTPVVNSSVPGRVTAYHTIVLRKSPNSYIVTKLTDYDPSDTNALHQAGTLRLAVTKASSGDHVTFDIRSSTNGVPDYPAVIRLGSPLVLNNNLTFDGPGADNLSISGDTNADGTADVQLFTINAAVTMNRLTFTKGSASFAGGAFEVSASGSLTLSYCAVTASTAAIWGGGIDVTSGSLNLDHCLIAGNSTSSALGQGGGGVSLFTYLPCSIVNTTFATNRQNAIGGTGGGALYASTSDPGLELDVDVFSCTFHDNRDNANHGTAICPDYGPNTEVNVQNTIVADGQGKNIDLYWGGLVVSLGGNISDDVTGTTFTIGGGTGTNIFNQTSDQWNVKATNLFVTLANNGGPTLTYPLIANSPAIGVAVSNIPGAVSFTNTLGTDQRGYFRDSHPDVGAFERGAGQRLIIEEVQYNPAPTNPNDQFIEFYVPHDATNVDVTGFKVLVDGMLRHTFTSQILEPGQALVLFSQGAVNTGVPSGVFSQMATNSLTLDTGSGLITLLNASNQVVFTADYVGAFVATDPTNNAGLSANYQSVMLSPEFQGVFLPYQRVVAKVRGSDTNGLSNAGHDALGNPLAPGNAPPSAYADTAATDAHTVLTNINILANDVDPDINDTIRVVGVGTNGNPGVTNLMGYSVLGARLTINNSPTTGVSISYDPTASAMLTALPQGSNVVDSFQYTILDSLGGADHYRGTNALDVSSSIYTQNLARATATVTVSVVGVNSAPTPQNDNVTNNMHLTTLANAVLDFTTATNILWNDTDPNSDDNSNTLSIVSISPTNGYIPNTLSVTSALGATVTLDLRFNRYQAHITYDPLPSPALLALGQNQTNYDTFYYSVSDRYGAIGTAAVAIQVVGVNNGPTANPDALATDENTPTNVPFAFFLTNDTDPDTEDKTNLTIVPVTEISALGASVVISNGFVVYDPTVSTNILNALARKEFVADTFTYTALDPWGLTSNAVVTVTVTGRNDAPVSQPDPYTTGEKIPFPTNAPGVLANDRDPDIHDFIRVIPATNTTPFGVTVAVNADGSFIYDPRTYFDWLYQSQTTNDSFSYVVMDHSLSIANDDSFNVTVSSTNILLPVLTNDVILSQVGGVFAITGLSAPSQGGTVLINTSSNALIYTPVAGFTGVETFNYTNADGLGGGDWAAVTVTVTGSKLYANADSFTVAKGTTNVLNVLPNDTILPATGGAITITGLGTPNSGGAVSLNGFGPNNQVNYSSGSTQACPYVESFTYVATSGALVSTGVVNVTVIDRTTTLPSQNDTFTVQLNGGLTSLDVLANDHNLSAPGTNLIITTALTNSILGTVSLNSAQNRLVYKPSTTVLNNYSDSIQYWFTDNAGGTGTAYLTVNVVAGGLIANDDYFVVEQNSVSNALPVMVNDVIIPNLGQTLYITDIGIGSNAPNHGGTVTINGPGTGLIYTPSPTNNTGGEDFAYEITDGSPARAQAQVHVTVTSFATVVSNPDVYRVQPNSTNNLLPVLNNDYPLPQLPGALAITGLQTNGLHGTVAYNNSPNATALLYTPNAGFLGQDVFKYIVTDGVGNQGTNSATITVGGLYLRDDAFSALSGSVSNTFYVLANDYVYPDTNSVRPIYQLGVPDQGGTVTTNSNGTAVIYTPANNFVGVEKFTYTLKDDSTILYSATATVTVAQNGSDRDTNTVTMTLVGTNDLPTIVGSTNSAITDKQTVNPFASMTVADVDQFNQQLQIATIQMDHLDNETLTNLGGFVQTAVGVFTMTDTPPNITIALRGIVFVPTPNHIIVPTTVTTHLTLSLNDQYLPPAFNPVAVTNLTTVAVTAVNDAPTIAGTGTYSINDKQTVNPFPSVVVADVDNDTTQALIAHITLDHVDDQSLTNLGGFINQGGGVYVYGSTNGSVTAAMITTALQGIVLVPTPNHITVPTTVTTRLTLSVDDTFAFTVGNSATTVSITASNDAPTIAGTGTYSINDKQTVNPFASVVVADVDNDALQSLTVHIALDHLDNQSLTNLGGFTLVTNGYFVMTATPTNVTTALRGIVLVPTPNHIPVPTSVMTHLSLAVDDGFAPTVADNITTVTITATNDAPVVTGNGNYFISDKQSVYPFATINVVDVDNDGLQPLVLEISLDHLDNGALQNLGGFTQITNGLFEIYGTPSNITKALRGIVYVPVPNHIPVPTTVTTHLTLSVDDGFIAALVTNLTTVSVTASNDAPVISGTVAGQTVYDRSFIKPFTTVLITEVDNDTTQALRVTVTLDNAIKGNLSSLGGFSNLGGGVYSYGSSNGIVTAAMATTALRGLLFTPTTGNRVTPGTPETTRFTIRVDDFFAPTVVDSNTTVVAIDPLTAAVAPSDKTNVTKFGWAVATTRDLAVVGAPNDGLNTNSGAVFLFARSLNGSNTWTQTQILLPPDGRAADAFGTAVAISGNTLVVGAPFNSSPLTSAGAAYVYTNQTGTNLWGFQKKLVSTNAIVNDQFGSAVAISGDDIVVGIPLSDVGSQGDAGEAFIFERNQSGANQWGIVKRLLSTNPFIADHFGGSVAINGNDVVVGVPLSDSSTQGDIGSAYIFERNQSGANQWGILARLTSTNPIIADHFGASVAISSNDVVVGVPLSDTGVTGDTGSAYIFERNQPATNQWGIVARLVSTNPVASDQFGSSVAMDGDVVVVGTPLADASGIDSGATYLFNRNQNGSNVWGQVDKFLPAAVGASDNFGCAVAIASNTVVVGAYNGLNSGVRCGAAYMFRIKFNNGPRVALPLADQTVTPSSPLAYTVPAGAFTDSDVNETLLLSLGTSPAAPVWVNFNVFTGAFSGTPGVVGTNAVAVVATDSEGLSATNQFNLYVPQVVVDSHTLLLGFQTLGVGQVITVALQGVPGTTYKLQRTPSLAGTVVWTDVATSMADAGGAISFYDVMSSDKMFYRAVPQ